MGHEDDRTSPRRDETPSSLWGRGERDFLHINTVRDDGPRISSKQNVRIEEPH